METRKTQLQPNNYYHIYNRGINGQNIFLEAKNYEYFLKKYSQYIFPFFDTFAYCLLKNHFHVLVQAKSENDIRLYLKDQHKEKSNSWILSNAFSSLFKSYAQAINKQYERTGGLFEEPFQRIEVASDAYFSHLIYYIHSNPQKHNFVSDFKDYEHSSYHSHLLAKATKLKRENVLAWFGGAENYLNFHSQYVDIEGIKNIILEF
jgi:REP element-mobilizing transposase RayT